MNKVTITFDDRKQKSFDQGVTLLQIAKETYPDTYPQILAAQVDNQPMDLSTTIEKSVALRFLTADDPEGLKIFWHSAAHVMAQAVKAFYPEALLGIGPAISNGFYYDFRLEESLNENDFSKIEAKMKKIVNEDQPFVRKILSKDEAVALFEEKKELFKLELIRDILDNKVSVYKNGNFVDLCRGPHVPSTGYIKYFKLLSIAGAYWRGDERNPVMQRIYGIAFPEKKTLDEHLRKLEEAKNRDHRRLGKELDLFSFHPEGPGFPFWHPNGMVIYNAITEYVREVLAKHGYQEVKTPIILNVELWHRSGHWDNYKENMYFTKIDNDSYAIKPMNCPGGLLVYKSRPHSYRDLPLKLSELGLVHRHEKSGVLHGLFRVRQFTQDDAHVFCTPEQMEDEIVKLIDLINEIYHTFGYEHFQIELSTRPAKSIGTDEMWEKAEKALMHALERKNISYQTNPGEGAFYGPKIDYHIQDSLGRMWQCGTIQVDFSMPERFNLEYIGPDGEKHPPVMIHRAILGSVERFIGILIEHVGGAFPLWLAPTQCIILPISEKHHEYAEKILKMITEKDIRATVDNRSEKIGYKIREAEAKKIPYMCIVGDKEKTNETVSVRERKKGDTGEIYINEFIEKLQNDIKRRIIY